ncbi:MAG: hypothetical protein HDT15_07905 [Oscillibacter sp.]|nr:hypothetical protein [Oscillibacter sp.]
MIGEGSRLPGLVVAAFGLSPEELAVLKILRPACYPMVDCTDNFDLLLTRRPICIVLNPLALDEGQQAQLNDHMFDTEGPDSPIFLVTQDAEDILAFRTLRVSLTARRNRTRSKVIKQLRDTSIDPFFAFDYDKVAPVFVLNDGFVVLYVDTNTYDLSLREIIRISAIWVADFECLERFETLVHTDLPVFPDVTEETGITNEMLSNAPSLSDALKMLGSWHSLDVLAAYNWKSIYSLLSPVQKQSGYAFDEGRIKLDLRRLLLRLFPAWFSRNSVNIDSALRLVPWYVSANSSYCEKLAQLLILALKYLWTTCDIHTVTDILQLYQDNDLARATLKSQTGGRKP